jgi:pyruvate kinase
MRIPACRTRIVCTIGPASSGRDVLEGLAAAGMDIARINLSHGDFEHHAKTVETIRALERESGFRVTIMADLPGPKMRIGGLTSEPIELRPGDSFTLTTEEVAGDASRVSVTFRDLPRVVKRGDTLYLNDGVVQLQVEEAAGTQVRCRVVVGGELGSRKGLNLPGIDLGASAFTGHDRECLAFCAANGVDAVCQSFVVGRDDLAALKAASRGMDYDPFVIAKIERSMALENIDGIIDEADGIMIARGDLGVEIPIECMAVVQKRLVQEAVLRGRPVVTATQMLESMTQNRRPTRAEATDVANAVLDGTDCVMLSAESAMGRYPVEAAGMLVRIARATEPFGPGYRLRERLSRARETRVQEVSELVALSVDEALRHVIPAAVFVPTSSGATARRIARFRPAAWIVAVCTSEAVCRRLAFTAGVIAVHEPRLPSDWKGYCASWLAAHGMDGGLVIVASGPSPENPLAGHRMEIIELSGG